MSKPTKNKRSELAINEPAVGFLFIRCGLREKEAWAERAWRQRKSLSRFVIETLNRACAVKK